MGDAVFGVAARIVMGIFYFICFSVVAVVGTFFVPINSGRTTTTTEVAAKAYGLEPGKKYSFRYGRIISGSSGYAAARGGLFSSSAVVNLKPSSAMDVSFSNGENSYILELPFKNIRFIPTTKKQPSLTLYLQNTGFGQVDSTKGKDFHWKIVPHYSHPGKSLEETDWFKDMKQAGQLSSFVDAHFDSAVVILSPKDYSRILGE